MSKKASLRTPLNSLIAHYKLDKTANWNPYKSLIDGNIITVADQHMIIPMGDPRKLIPCQWGHVLFWMEGNQIGNRVWATPIETVFNKEAFKESIQKRRCLIPFNTIYKEQGGEVFKISLKKDTFFSVAGIYDQVHSPTEGLINTFVLLTLQVFDSENKFFNHIPFILQPEYEDLWLNPGFPIVESIELIEPLPYESLSIEKVDNP